ncbi:uncharacterized protein FOMMEDRAFT_154691 [Fomitiporia mediterranea MF3/22]|uniref:uncharacterized protein n=1 Tax=Fomitiporia mediterranea (strain MF3/22) TaxID=694068 RepID=UPI0004407336|nr:uncharacterized protein FOMMEDRAFT_154691 [Fomitiporia mediterranea MF3/22]EJD03608.1 hypothetical protein FOMMEDRAFT_154691 [Fomitiporia mediterranea MF3/22]
MQYQDAMKCSLQNSGTSNGICAGHGKTGDSARVVGPLHPVSRKSKSSHKAKFVNSLEYLLDLHAYSCDIYVARKRMLRKEKDDTRRKLVRGRTRFTLCKSPSRVFIHCVSRRSTVKFWAVVNYGQFNSIYAGISWSVPRSRILVVRNMEENDHIFRDETTVARVNDRVGIAQENAQVKPLCTLLFPNFI